MKIQCKYLCVIRHLFSCLCMYVLFSVTQETFTVWYIVLCVSVNHCHHYHCHCHCHCHHCHCHHCHCHCHCHHCRHHHLLPKAKISSILLLNFIKFITIIKSFVALIPSVDTVSLVFEGCVVMDGCTLLSGMVEWFDWCVADVGRFSTLVLVLFLVREFFSSSRCDSCRMRVLLVMVWERDVL